MNDMKDQGMSSLRQLAYVSASLFLGKHASRKECAGLNAGETAGISDVIRKAAKMPGAKTLTDTLKESMESRSRVPLDTFINRLTDSLSNAGDDHAGYAAQASSKIRSFYNRVCEVVDDELAVPLYFEDLVQFSHVGRGIPKQVDLELVRIAEKRAYGIRNPKQKGKATGNIWLSNHPHAAVNGEYLRHDQEAANFFVRGSEPRQPRPTPHSTTTWHVYVLET